MTHAVAGDPQLMKAPGDKSYFYDSELPLTSLVFLLPLVVLYEVGTQRYTAAAQHGYDQQIIAFTMMQKLFGFCGVHAQHLPALAVLAVLLFIHLFRGERWHFHPTTLIGMAAESMLLTLPLLVLARQLARYFPLSASEMSRHDMVIMSLGAGVYEELVFRLMLFSLLAWAAQEELRKHPMAGRLGVVLVGALAFSAYHYLSPTEHFAWRSFVFRTLAGIYFGGTFLLRGFGVTAGCHACYDILILFL